jgi:hypothetical protein
VICCIDLTNVAAGLSALLTPLIGLTTVLILILQFRLAAQKTRLALYKERYPVFKETLRFIDLVTGQGKVSIAQLILFRRYTEENQFLFRENVPIFMKLLFTQGTDLLTTINLLNTEKNQADLERYAQRRQELFEWFGNQAAVAKRLFGQYLRIPR